MSSRTFAPVVPYWLHAEKVTATAHQSGTAVPSRRAPPSSRRFAPTTNYWEPSPARRPATNEAAPVLASIEYGRCGKPVGVAVMERAPRREMQAAVHAVGPEFAPSVPYWIEPGALATNAARGWAARWATVWNAIRPGESAFAVNA